MRAGIQLLYGLAQLPFVRRGRPHGLWLTAVVSAYLALDTVGDFGFPAALPALRWLVVTYGDASLCAGLLFAGLFGLSA